MNLNLPIVQQQRQQHQQASCFSANIECKQVDIGMIQSTAVFPGTGRSFPPRPSWTRRPTSAKVRHEHVGHQEAILMLNVKWMFYLSL